MNTYINQEKEKGKVFQKNNCHYKTVVFNSKIPVNLSQSLVYLSQNYQQ